MTEKGHNVLPKSYSSLAIEAMDYVERNIGMSGVRDILQVRSLKILDEYRKCIDNLDEDELVDKLKSMRNSDGYIAEVKKLGIKTFELSEYNCPILQISEKYSEACNSERKLFEELLGAEVESTHRIVSGSKICRFLIRFNEKYE
ncbi:transcriptional regulator [mine drainage metagenome]|uniref:Transcriptional regulator n=1 Tax=mine drainage metagenome TaxID=410659 RepID=T1CXJ6_9ZZZZ